MPIATLFTVRQEDLTRLRPGEAVDRFRELLWAEARRIGLPINKIRVSSLVDVPDGGIDAAVEASLPVPADLIKEGRTGYQIKASANFKPWQQAEIKEELFGRGKEPTRENLGSGVRGCMDEGGTYVLVCFKQDPTDPQHRQAVDHLKYFFQRCGYGDPKVEVWGQSTLIGFLEPVPSLALRVKGLGHTKFQTHWSWSNNDDMRKDFKAGEEQNELVLALRGELRRNDGSVHVRVGGEPGVGKTKLVLEATSAEDLRPLVVYCDKPSVLVDSDLMNEILREDSNFSAILVVDECDPDSTYYIWNKLKHRGARIKLVSIYSEGFVSGDVPYFELESLDDEQIAEIIEEYGLPRDQAERWVGICDGSPRVAHVIGWNLKTNPEDILKHPGTVNIWDRYVCHGDDPRSERVRQRRLILSHIALFKRFGYGPPVLEEARAIHRMVEQADPQITWHRFQANISELREWKILQGGTTLYITPKALQIKLWIDWWETYGGGFDLENFSKELTETLRDWFNEMFQYAAGSAAASRVVRDLLGEGGPFQNTDLLRTTLGARFFLALTEADPRSALQTLKKTVGTWSKEELLEFTTGRREVVWALEKLAVWRNLFSDAARLLLALGEAENESYSNNASGVFAGLFSPGPELVAPTETPPKERLPILIEALNSSTKERRLLGLSACDQALESRHFSRIGRLQDQGLWPSARLWTPSTYEEWFDAYRQVWQLLRERVDGLPQDERQRAVDILIDHARGLGLVRDLADMVIETLSELAQKPYVDGKRILEKAVEVLHYEGERLPANARDRWERLRDQLTGEGFQAMMKRYVGMDLVEDKFDEQGNHVDQTQPRIEELAQQAAADSSLLKPELGWLVTTEARNGYRFGYELGKRDPGLELLPTLLEAQKNADSNVVGYFLGGYFRALFERDQEEWEKKLDSLAEDDKLRAWVPELTWRSGETTDRAALRVLKVFEEGAVDVRNFRMFAWGGAVRHLTEDVFVRMVEFLLGHPDTIAASIALDLAHFYYHDGESGHALPKDLTIRILTHPALLEKQDGSQRDQMNGYYWTEIAQSFIQLYPREGLNLAEFMLAHFGEDGTIFEGFFSQTQNVLTEIVRLCPEQLWVRITEYLGPPIDSRAFSIRQWLRGGDLFEAGAGGVLNLMPLAAIWRWVDEDVEQRGWYIAVLVPPRLFRAEGRVCLAREILVRYGDREDVRRNLMANFSTEGWTGPESLHLQRKKEKLVEFKEGEKDQNVRQWVDEYVATLDRDIEQAQIEEERRGY